MISVDRAKREDRGSMKVLLLNQEYPPLGGGGANATYYLLKEYSKIDPLEVHVLTAAANGVKPSEWIYRNVCLHFLKIGKSRPDFWTQKELLEYSIKAFFRARSLARELRFDLCHAFFTIPCGLVARATRPELPYLISLRGSDVPGFNARFSYHYPILKPIVRHLWRKAAMVVANSRWLKELALKTYPGLVISVLPNGVDCDFFRPSTERKRETVEALKIACVSRLIGRKGVEDLLEAFSLARNEVPEAGLLIVGGGALEGKLRKRCSELEVGDKVKFLGNKDRREVAEILSNSDIFVLPSHSEGMSNSLLEAMACGLPVIATDTGDASSIVDGNGLVVPRGEVEAMRRAIVELSSSRELREQMGARSRQIATKRGWGAVAEGYFSAYEKIISRAQKCAVYAAL